MDFLLWGFETIIKIKKKKVFVLSFSEISLRKFNRLIVKVIFFLKKRKKKKKKRIEIKTITN